MPRKDLPFHDPTLLREAIESLHKNGMSYRLMSQMVGYTGRSTTSFKKRINKDRMQERCLVRFYKGLGFDPWEVGL